MREHAIPQDVVGYKFHIVGNMTLKQFLEVAAGCVVGLVFYNTNLYPFIKWPLIGFSVAVGAMAAFVPFEERPFDHWIVTFFRILYKPTKFFWRKEPQIPAPFLFKPQGDANAPIELDLTPYRHQRIKEYLGSFTAQGTLDSYEKYERDRIDTIMATFNNTAVVGVSLRSSHKPHLRTRLHSLRAGQIQLPDEVKSEYVDQAALVQAAATPEPTQEYLPTKQQLAANQVAQTIEIPEVAEISVKKQSSQTDVVSEAVPVVADQDRSYSTASAAQVSYDGAATAAVNASLPFPSKPSEPNKLVGMVLSPGNELLVNAIVEIQDQAGRAVRAVKTNALGQFFISTPLDDGTYTILTEKEGYAFQPLLLELQNSVVEPIEIRSQN